MGGSVCSIPGLCIVHCPGQVHSNVDPISHLPRIPPHNSPIRDNIEHIEPEPDKIKMAQRAEDKSLSAPAKKATFIVRKWEDIIVKTSCEVGKNRRNVNTGPKSPPAIRLDKDPPNKSLPLTPIWA
jgi:hypothetical protein